MYRVLAVVMMAYAICYPRIALQASASAETYTASPTRAERLVEDLSAWLRRPIDRVILAINKTPVRPGG